MKETKEKRKEERFTRTPYPLGLNLQTRHFFNKRHPAMLRNLLSSKITLRAQC